MDFGFVGCLAFSNYFKLFYVIWLNFAQTALRYGLKHPILPKKVKQDEVKTNIEKLIYSLKRKNPNIPIDDEFQDQTKFYLKRFLTESDCLCSTNQNQSLHSTLRKLSQNEKIKIHVCQYDKGNTCRVVVLNSEDYYSKLDHIIDDPTKFIKVDPDGKVHPIIAKENLINYYINKYLKLYNNSITSKIVSTGSAPGKLYEI